MQYKIWITACILPTLPFHYTATLREAWELENVPKSGKSPKGGGES